MNVNKGRKICLRLRYPGDRNQFLPVENVVDTMLHELAHIVHGPHNQHFHALWDQLRDECQGLMMKGYTGEGFLGQGRRLGGARMPEREVRRVAREAAERRRGQSLLSAASRSSGQKLGGAAPRPGQDIRQTITAAVERRNTVLRGCGSERLNDRQIHEIADTATRNGFKTQAEEDEANEAAIAQALWELVQEDEKARLGPSYVRPSAQGPRPAGTRGLSSSSGRHAAAGDVVSKQPGSADGPGGQSSDTNSWVCSVCTLHNPLQYLCCDACGSERARSKRSRSPHQTLNPTAATQPTKAATSIDAITIDLTNESQPRKRKQNPRAGPKREAPATSSSAPVSQPLVWLCNFCGTAMERQWWTCSMCGKMKESSR